MNPKTMNHYRTYMKIYGLMIVMLADSDEEVLKLINDEHSGPLLEGLRDRIENSPRYEHETEGNLMEQITTQQFEAWKSAFPKRFPEELQHDNVYHNPFIKNHKIYTHQAVYQGIRLLEAIAGKDSSENGFSLDDNARWAYVCFLECLSGAMAFEDKHRNDGEYSDY